MLRNDSDLLEVKKGDSQLWHFICQQSDLIKEGTKWQIRNGENVSFFDDFWLIPGTKLKDLCTRPLSLREEQSKVADWVAYGSWDFVNLATVLPSNIILKLIAVIPPSQRAGNDIMSWNASSNGIFTLKSAYFLIEKIPPNLYSPTFKVICKWRGEERIRLFSMDDLPQLATNKFVAQLLGSFFTTLQLV